MNGGKELLGGYVNQETSHSYGVSIASRAGDKQTSALRQGSQGTKQVYSAMSPASEKPLSSLKFDLCDQKRIEIHNKKRTRLKNNF